MFLISQERLVLAGGAVTRKATTMMPEWQVCFTGGVEVVLTTKMKAEIIQNWSPQKY